MYVWFEACVPIHEQTCLFTLWELIQVNVQLCRDETKCVEMSSSPYCNFVCGPQSSMVDIRPYYTSLGTTRVSSFWHISSSIWRMRVTSDESLHVHYARLWHHEHKWQNHWRNLTNRLFFKRKNNISWNGGRYPYVVSLRIKDFTQSSDFILKYIQWFINFYIFKLRSLNLVDFIIKVFGSKLLWQMDCLWLKLDRLWSSHKLCEFFNHESQSQGWITYEDKVHAHCGILLRKP